MSHFDVGALVSARGRDWVVQPESAPENALLVLRPLGGTDDDEVGIDTRLETVTSAEFELPAAERELGNHLACGLLRDAMRLSFRAGAGPFRSLARIAIEPRPYQLVPLLMALRQDPVRLLIADDVGVGKTVEACLIARELFDRGEIERIAVLCPPHLAEQWHAALTTQFNLPAKRILPGTAARLERNLGAGEVIFERHPHVVVSTDYIKSDRRRLSFINHCPELIIVDEAHTCAQRGGRGAAQQRYALLKALAADPNRHVLLVTATPHSGDDDAFRSLLTLLDPALAELPSDLSGDQNRKHRDHIARHLVQRRRPDLVDYVGARTTFPDRVILEEAYSLSKSYRALFDRMLDFCRERVFDTSLDAHRRRVRWWSALAMLRALSSSPAAAEATLRSRSAAADTTDAADADAQGRLTVLDLDDEGLEGQDVVPGAQTDTDDGAESTERRRMLALAREAAKLRTHDNKLKGLVEQTRLLLAGGFSPIVFCRYIATVGYVVDGLRKALKKKPAMVVEVQGVDGSLPHDERERRVRALGEYPCRILVCTDCLSEGINLQANFDAVVHYDLSWNPTRHEQREGRVDRFGQRKPKVRVLRWVGRDNPFDGFMMDHLLRKQDAIRKQLGITVPAPASAGLAEAAFLEWLRLKKTTTSQLMLPLETAGSPSQQAWDQAVEREQRGRRSLFAQATIRPEEIFSEVVEMRRALGDDATVERFVTSALRGLGQGVTGEAPTRIDLKDPRPALREALGLIDPNAPLKLRVSFGDDPAPGAVHLGRTHSLVEGLAGFVVETAIDPEAAGDLPVVGARTGVVRTASVQRRTTVLLLRLRFHIHSLGRDGKSRTLLAEDQALMGFIGQPSDPTWIDEDALLPLLDAEPGANVSAAQARNHLKRVLAECEALRPHLNQVAEERAARLLDAHKRVRKQTRQHRRGLRVEPKLPLDVLGVYVYLPVTPGASR